MTSRTKSYGLPPNWDFPPNGLIKLGSIITNPLKPHQALNKGRIVEIPPDAIQTPDPTEDWEIRRGKLYDNSIGLFANITGLVGFGPEVGYNYKRDKNAVYKAKLLKTTYFDPEKEYLLKAVGDEKVKNYMEEGYWKRPVYMITGLKIVEGFSASSSDEATHGETGKFAIDLTAVAAPVTAGTKGSLSNKTKERTSFKLLPNCVFAYQVVRIRLGKEDQIKWDDYNKHALMDLDQDHDEEGLVLDWEDETVEDAEAAEVQG